MQNEQPLTRDERIALGKICGCGHCWYCNDWRIERVTLAMLEEISQGKEIAELGRKEWLDKHVNRS
jgi:hypothetical protein